MEEVTEKKVIYADRLDYSLIAALKRQPKGKKAKKPGVNYADIITAFDIETTTIDRIKQAVMYIWQFQLGPEITIIGRTWEEFRRFYDRTAEALPKGLRIVVWVHNLSFDGSFLRSIIPFDEILALDDRKYLKIVSGPFEFRCSYLHSNMSLAKFLQAQGVPDQKITGFDYRKKRWPWTRLTEQEILYCINDVRGLVEAIAHEMQHDGDNLYSIPATSTGYVRREAKRTLGRMKKFIRPMLPDLEVFRYLRAAFRGGNTHANRWNSNRLIKANKEAGFSIHSWDISSSYPSSLLTEKFPGEFFEKDPSKFELCLKHGKACLMRVSLFDVRLKDPLWGCPYLSEAKCQHIVNGEYDNGRILSADSLTCVITEIDFSIIESEYEFTYTIDRLFVARKQMLPQTFRDWLLDLYRKKTLLKGEDPYLYQKTKNKFNSAYGMMVQNPCKDELIYVDGLMQPDPNKTEEDYIQQYQEKGWLPYQWGVWCTCYARLKLEAGLRCIPPESFLYADTDSIKYVGDYEERFEALNEQLLHPELAAVDRHGEIHHIGIFECETQDPMNEIREFKTMGAKKYCYVDGYGLHVTVSGVVKGKGAEELGSIENFKEGFVFKKAGGTEIRYNDQMEPTPYHIDGHDILIGSNVCISDSTYTLSLTAEYSRLLDLLMTTDIRKSLYVGQDDDL